MNTRQMKHVFTTTVAVLFVAVCAATGPASAAEYKVTWDNQLRGSTDSYFSVTVKPLAIPGMTDVTASDNSTRLTFGQTLTMTVSATSCSSIKLHVTRTRPFTKGGRETTESTPLWATVPCAATTTATVTGSGIDAH